MEQLGREIANETILGSMLSAPIQRPVGSGQEKERESADSEVPKAATSDFREAFRQARAESCRGA